MNRKPGCRPVLAFGLGFAGWYLCNTLPVSFVGIYCRLTNTDTLISIFDFLMWSMHALGALVILAVLVRLFRRQRPAALGILAAWTTNLIASLFTTTGWWDGYFSTLAMNALGMPFFWNKLLVVLL